MEAKKLPNSGSIGLARDKRAPSFESSLDNHNSTSLDSLQSFKPQSVREYDQKDILGQSKTEISYRVSHPSVTKGADAVRRDRTTDEKTGTSTLKSLSRRGSVFVKKSRNSVDSLLRSSKADVDQPALPQKYLATTGNRTADASSTTPSIPPPSQSRAPSSIYAEGATDPPPPEKAAYEEEDLSQAKHPSRKDELKSAFHGLEADCQKFLSKPVAVRTSVVRLCLFPFLVKYGSKSSHEGLRLEDVEKRCIVLKTWWAALLQTLKAKPSENLSEVDRATLRDAIIGIMERPEWVSGNWADIQSNCAQMIYKQLSYVTEKMSQRKLPTNANLISFCGKSCAYAFIYCPHAAEVLIDAWDIPAACLKRVLQSSGVEKPWKSGLQSTSIARRFPRHLQSLAFVSFKTSTTILKSKPEIPPELTHIRWDDCHWTNRWSGKQSYLFCEFLQYFHFLLSNLIPMDSTNEDVLFAPGVLFVHAQMAHLLDHMIHPQTNSSSLESNEGFSPQIFDDVLRFDAAAPTLSAPPAVAHRQVADSHIVRLAREFLLDHTEICSWACQLFAQGLCRAMKATAVATSVFDHSACFALCEFLQEILKVVTTFERQTLPSVSSIGWLFWVEVLQKMLQSENTMTEIRAYVLLFNIWPVISSLSWLKERICYDVILDADHFHHRFNHWCPMVRGYYMRLLCWRMARFDGHHSEWETRILERLLLRLRNTWSQHKALRVQIQNEDLIPLSTTPCNPAPGRRLLIIRTDIPSTPTSLALSRVTTSTSTDADIFGPSNNSAFNPAQLAEKLSLSLSSTLDPTPKRNSLFRSIMGNRTPDKGSRSKSPTRTTSSTPQSPQRHHPHDSGEVPRQSVSMPPSPNGSARPSFYEPRPAQSLSTSPTKHYRPATFKFSLELVDPRRAMLQPIDLEPPRLPQAAHQHLQSRPSFWADGPTPLSVATAGNGRSVVADRQLKYSGRALAEWTLVVNECQNFFERRRAEGVPNNRLVETPVLTVESLRRPL